MSSLLYKGHSIIYRPALDTRSGEYAATAQLVWHGPKGKHDAHSFTSSQRFTTASQAEAAALKEAIAWADERLAMSGQSAQPKTQSRTADSRVNESARRPDGSGDHALMAAPPRGSH